MMLYLFRFICLLSFVFSPPKHILVKQQIITFCGGATNKCYSLYSAKVCKMNCRSFMNFFETLGDLQSNIRQVAGCGVYIITNIKNIVCCCLCNNRETNPVMICQHSFEKEIHLSTLNSLNQLFLFNGKRIPVSLAFYNFFTLEGL